MVWESMSDVSERIQSMTGSSSDSHTTQYVVQPVEQCFVQSFLRHRGTSQRSRFGNSLEIHYYAKAGSLKRGSLFLLSFNLLLLEFIFYRGKIDNLSRIYLRGRYK